MPRSRLTLVVVLLLATWAGAPAHAQFWDKFTNPKVKVPIRHPPGLGLQINKIAFGPAKGEAAQQFIDSLTEHFVKANVEVVERQQLENLLAEHNFSLSGYVDSGSAAEMGRILGPSVLVFVDIPRYHAEQQKLYNHFKDGKGFPHTTWISRTQASAKGSVRAVDLATGRVFAAQTLIAQTSLENKIDDECCAEFPSEDEVLDRAMNELVGKAHQLFLPWTEVTELIFFDDKDCNLHTAQQYMKGGNLDTALQQSLTNLEGCKTSPKGKEKQMWHANYNVGMGYFATGDFARALEYLNAAQQIKNTDIATEAIGTCMKAQLLAKQMQRVEERMVLDASMGSKRTAESDPQPPAQQAKTGKAVPSTAARPSHAGPKAQAEPAPATAKSDSSIEERILKLDALFKKGLINKPEYDKKKAELLKEL